jgi:hypothetical protein
MEVHFALEKMMHRYLQTLSRRLQPRRTLCTAHTPQLSAHISTAATTGNALIDTSNDPQFPLNDILVQPNFINPSEAECLVADCERLIRRNRLRYQPAHFDHVIAEYREMPATDDKWSPASRAVFTRMRQLVAERFLTANEINGDKKITATNTTTTYPEESSEKALEEKWRQVGGWRPIHLLDLDRTGKIGAHVDHTQYAGSIVSALCLLSTSVIRFRSVGDPAARYADALLRPGTFYAQRYINYVFIHFQNLIHLNT